MSARATAPSRSPRGEIPPPPPGNYIAIDLTAFGPSPPPPSRKSRFRTVGGDSDDGGGGRAAAAPASPRGQRAVPALLEVKRDREMICFERTRQLKELTRDDPFPGSSDVMRCFAAAFAELCDGIPAGSVQRELAEVLLRTAAAGMVFSDAAGMRVDRSFSVRADDGAPPPTHRPSLPPSFTTFKAKALQLEDVVAALHDRIRLLELEVERERVLRKASELPEGLLRRMSLSHPIEVDGRQTTVEEVVASCKALQDEVRALREGMRQAKAEVAYYEGQAHAVQGVLNETMTSLYGISAARTGGRPSDAHALVADSNAEIVRVLSMPFPQAPIGGAAHRTE